MALAVVAPVMEEERIVGVLFETLLRVGGRDRACCRAMAGPAGASVAAECFLLEEPLALERLARPGAGRSQLAGPKEHGGHKHKSHAPQ